MRSSFIRQRPQPAEPAPQPVYSHSQAQQRERRQKWLRVHYRGDFDLAAEIREIVDPLAGQVAALPGPLVLREDIENVADAVHEVVSTVVGMLAESKQLDRAAHARVARAVGDLAQRPAAPEISDEQISAGSWAVALVELAEPLAGDLAAFLGRALPPHSPGLAGPSASERLEAALRVLDGAAVGLARRIPKAAARQALPSIAEVNAANRARQDRERAQRALAKMQQTTIGVPR